MENENKSFSCVLCGNKLSSKEALQEHFRRHANKEIDGKGRLIPKIKPQAEEDKSTGSGNEAIHCDICFMNFATITLAIQHKFRKHPESSSKFYCPFCGMQFPLKFTRDKHVQSHQGMSTVGSFPCSDCGVIFHNMGAQTYHVKSIHKRLVSMFQPVPTPPPSKKIKINNANEAQSVYYCYLCGTEYIIKFNLQKHLERQHTEEERNTVPCDFIKCTTCDALFYNKRAYDTHNMYHRPDDLYVTSEEQRLQTVSRVDQDFDIRRVQQAADKFIPVDRHRQHRRKPDVSVDKARRVDLDELSPDSSVDSSDSEEQLLANDKGETSAEEGTHDVKQKSEINEGSPSNQAVHQTATDDNIKNCRVHLDKINASENNLQNPNNVHIESETATIATSTKTNVDVQVKEIQQSNNSVANNILTPTENTARRNRKTSNDTPIKATKVKKTAKINNKKKGAKKTKHSKQEEKLDDKKYNVQLDLEIEPSKDIVNDNKNSDSDVVNAKIGIKKTPIRKKTTKKSSKANSKCQKASKSKSIKSKQEDTNIEEITVSNIKEKPSKTNKLTKTKELKNKKVKVDIDIDTARKTRSQTVKSQQEQVTVAAKLKRGRSQKPQFSKKRKIN